MKSFIILAAAGSVLVLSAPALAQYETYETATNHNGNTPSNPSLTHPRHRNNSSPYLTDATVTNWSASARHPHQKTYRKEQSQAELGGPN